MSITPQSNSYYWYNGAFCENCGILTGIVTYKDECLIGHQGCKSGCNTTWNSSDFCPTVDHEKACAYRAFMAEYILRESEILNTMSSIEDEDEDEDEEDENSFQGDNFDNCFEDQNEVAEPEQVLLWTTVDGKDYIKCEKTKTIYDFATYKDTFELVILGKWCEKMKKIDFEAKEEEARALVQEYYPGTYMT